MALGSTDVVAGPWLWAVGPAPLRPLLGPLPTIDAPLVILLESAMMLLDGPVSGSASVADPMNAFALCSATTSDMEQTTVNITDKHYL